MKDAIIEHVSLMFRSGSSDKVYHAQIVQTDDDPGAGYVVNFQHGRRNGTLVGGIKTASPTTLEAARKCFNNLVREKTGKGYVPFASSGESALTSSVANDRSNNDSGIRPQLLNECDETTVEHLIHDAHWGAQEKKNGERRLLQAKLGKILGINRKGLYVPIPRALHDLAANVSRVHADFIIDGEIIGETLYAFDMLEIDHVSLRPLPFSERYAMLADLVVLALGLADGPETLPLRAVGMHSAAQAKRDLFDTVRDSRGEGVVFKRLSSPYEPGKPNSGGDQLKYKFVHSATVLVIQRNEGARSVRIGAFDASGRMTPIGNVTIPPNRPVPYPDMLVEVRYLYAYTGGSLYQPVYLGPRDDLDAEAATLDQLHYKPIEN